MLSSLWVWAVAQAAAPPEPARAWWEVFLIVMGALVSFTTVLALTWRIARPHVDRYMRGLIEPIAAQVGDVHEEVKPNHGQSMKDQASRIDERVQDVAGSIGRLHRRVDSVHERLTRVDARGRVVEGILQQHLDEARTATRALRRQGIHTTGTDERDPT